MTDFTDDELVSAVLDGEATDEEASRVYADVVLSARLDELRAARDTIAASVALPTSEQRDALIAMAVTSADAPADTPAAASLAIDMHDRRRRRRVLRVASLAAALLAVAGLVGAIAAIAGRDSRKSSSTAAGQSPSSSAQVQAAAQPGPASSLDTNSVAAAAGGLAKLGSFQTPQELVDAVKTQLPPAPEAPQALQPTGAAHANSSSTGVTCESRNNVTYIARASLSGQPVIVIVSASAGQRTIEVVDLNCTVVFTQPL